MNLTNDCDSIGQKFQLQGSLTIESKKRFIEYSPPFALFIIVLNSVLCLFAVFVNGFIVVTVLAYKQFRVPSNMLLACLAVSDFLLGALVQPSFIYGLVMGFQDEQRCTLDARVIMEIISGANLTTSMGFLLLITLDRYIAIQHALRYRAIVTMSRTTYIAIATWVFTTGLAIVNRLTSHNSVIIKIIWWGYVIGICLTISSVHFKIFLVSRRHVRQIYSQTKHLSTANRSRDRIKSSKSLKTFAIVFMVSILCFIPFCVLRMRESISTTPVSARSRLIRDIMYRVTLTLLLSNSSFNALFYFMRSKKLRRHARRLVCYRSLKK